MPVTFASASASYIFIDPKDPEQKKQRHTINYLIETPDAAKLISLGEGIKKVYPDLTLVGITTSVTNNVVADAPVTPAETGEATPPAEGQA